MAWNSSDVSVVRRYTSVPRCNIQQWVQTTRYRRPECPDDQQRLEDAEFSRAPWKDWVECERRTANGREFQSVMAGENKRIFENISTNWQWHKFLFIGGSSMPWWSWEMIQRNGWKVIERLVENRQMRVFATFEQGQPTKFIEQTGDRSCMTIIFFDKMGSTTLNSFELLDIFGHIRIPRCSGILHVETN